LSEKKRLITKIGGSQSRKRWSEPMQMLTTYQPWIHRTKERYIDNLIAHWSLWIEVIRRNKVMSNETIIEMYLNRVWRLAWTYWMKKGKPWWNLVYSWYLWRPNKRLISWGWEQVSVNSERKSKWYHSQKVNRVTR